jgi:hypothetical protein
MLIDSWLDTLSIATGSFILAKNERRIWNAVFLLFIVVFVTGLLHVGGRFRLFVDFMARVIGSKVFSFEMREAQQVQ